MIRTKTDDDASDDIADGPCLRRVCLVRCDPDSDLHDDACGSGGGDDSPTGADRYAHTYTKSDSYARSLAGPKSYPNTSSYTHAYSYARSLAGPKSYPNTSSYTHAYSCARSLAGPKSYPNTSSYTHANTYTDSDARSLADPNTNSYTHANTYTDSDAHPHADHGAHAHPMADAGISAPQVGLYQGCTTEHSGRPKSGAGAGSPFLQRPLRCGGDEIQSAGGRLRPDVRGGLPGGCGGGSAIVVGRCLLRWACHPQTVGPDLSGEHDYRAGVIERKDPGLFLGS